MVKCPQGSLDSTRSRRMDKICQSFGLSIEDVPANLTGMQNETNNRLAVENLVGTVSLAVERLVYTQ